jgi:hypothetical protein
VISLWDKLEAGLKRIIIRRRRRRQKREKVVQKNSQVNEVPPLMFINGPCVFRAK